MQKQLVDSMSNITTILILLLGIFLISFPSDAVSTLLPCLIHVDSSGSNLLTDLEGVLCRLVGGLLVTFAITWLFGTSISTDRATSTAQNNGERNIFDRQARITLFSQSIFGFCLVLIGLLGIRTLSTTANTFSADSSTLSPYCREFKALRLITLGLVCFLFACFGLMISYWPVSTTTSSNNEGQFVGDSDGSMNSSMDDYEEALLQQQRESTQGQDEEQGSTPNNESTVPLLSDYDDENIQSEDSNGNPNQNPHESIVNEPTAEDNNDTSSSNNSQDENDNVTSRITGTRRLIKLAGPHSFYLYIGCLALLIRLPFSLSISHFVSATLGALSRQSYYEAKKNILSLFVCGTIDAALDFWCVFLFGLANLKIAKNLRIDTFIAILRQDISFFDQTTSGELASRLNSDCGEMGGDLTWFFRFSIESVVRISGIVTYMLLRCPKLGATAISVVPIVAIVNQRYGRWLHTNAISVQSALADANSVAQEAFSCVRTVISFATEGFEKDKYKKQIHRHYDLNVKQLYAQGFYYMVISTFLINTCVQALLLYIGCTLVKRGDLKTEVLLAFMLYQGQLQNEVQNLFNSFTSLIKSSGAGDKVFALLDRVTPPPGTGSTDVQTSDENEDDEEEVPRQFEVALTDIHFAYPTRPGHHVLKGLTLDIPKGKTVALVGASGCGKSTIISLLQRLHDPSSGNIFIDGTNLKDINITSHRRHIGIVTQEPNLFSGTIQSNITYGMKNSNIETVINAAKLANAHDFIEKFPDQYQTSVGERGVCLSGGQKQRIAIARAIISKPSLLLLDEATSALDSESEKLVQAALDCLLKEDNDMTTIIIAHRLSTVRNADSIVVIQDGGVFEQGSHEELLKKEDGVYRKMVGRAQESGILPED